MVKLTLDLSDNGPVFSALDEMMMKMSMEGNDDKAKGKGQSGEAKNALKNLLKSGIPGIESMFGGEDPTPRFGKKGSGKKGFHKMNDQSKKKFMAAIFGELVKSIPCKQLLTLKQTNKQLCLCYH